MIIPPDIIAHCQQYTGCKGCPIGTCVAPLVDADSPKWNEWINNKITEIRELNAPNSKELD